MRKIVTVIIVLALMLSCTACSGGDDADINIGVLKGPTGVGAVGIMAKSNMQGEESEEAEYSNYHFLLSADPTDIVARLTNGELDIGALPTNTAANLYNKTNGDVEIIAVNCLGVLYILENGTSISSVADLKGRTVYVNGQGANPEYIINFVLRQNGLEPGEDVEIVFREATDISAMMVSGEAEVCMLPVPAATAVTIKNTDVRFALDMTGEYEAAAGDGSRLAMGCLVARREFVSEHQKEVDLFLERYETSIGEVLGDIDASAELVAGYEITANAAIAKKAIPDCSIVCITGPDMQPVLDGYYKVLFNAEPGAVGGAIPGGDFYYVP